jgi:hypothetical protein
MVTLRILSWSSDRAWVGPVPYYRMHLIRRLRSASPSLGRLDAKRLAQGILDGAVSEFTIESARSTQGLRLFLESRGAEVELS